MKNIKQPLSIKVIYWLTQVAFWLFVFVFVASIVFTIALLTESVGDKMQLHTGLPVDVKYTEKGIFYVYNEVQEVEFVEAIGKLHFINTNQKLAKWFGGSLMVIVIIFMYIFIMIKRFIRNVYHGLIFERFNIRMLKNIAYGLIAIWLFMNIYSRLFYYFIAKKISFEHLEITGEFNSYGLILVVALLLWVLSHIFMVGVKLREEQNLTV